MLIQIKDIFKEDVQANFKSTVFHVIFVPLYLQSRTHCDFLKGCVVLLVTKDGGDENESTGLNTSS